MQIATQLVQQAKGPVIQAAEGHPNLALFIAFVGLLGMAAGAWHTRDKTVIVGFGFYSLALALAIAVYGHVRIGRVNQFSLGPTGFDVKMSPEEFEEVKSELIEAIQKDVTTLRSDLNTEIASGNETVKQLRDLRSSMQTRVLDAAKQAKMRPTVSKASFERVIVAAVEENTEQLSFARAIADLLAKAGWGGANARFISCCRFASEEIKSQAANTGVTVYFAKEPTAIDAGMALIDALDANGFKAVPASRALQSTLDKDLPNTVVVFVGPRF